MSADQSTFPLAGLEAVASAQHQWVGLALTPAPGQDAWQAVLQLLGYPDVGAALAPLDCIVTLDDPLVLKDEHMATLPSSRIVLRIPAAVLAEAPVRKRCAELVEQGYRIVVDGEPGVHGSQVGVRGVTSDCAVALPSALALMSLPGPHWARNVPGAARLAVCRAAGMTWFSGPYEREPMPERGDGTARKRLLALLGLLARDADSRELETVLKQDPALSYHLLKLVNSAAFALSSPVHNFGQAINMLGRRQLQRWLQLLLYARQQDDSTANLLLPLAALRAAQMEALCKQQGGDRDRQDMAFVVGVFALLDVLLSMPMPEIVGALNLDADVAGALIERSGPLGELLALIEQPVPDAARLAALGLTAEGYWQSQLQGYHWAIQVSRNL
jgi:EAL and modified HD-GYP domain-containing signal transduction protein